MDRKRVAMLSAAAALTSPAGTDAAVLALHRGEEAELGGRKVEVVDKITDLEKDPARNRALLVKQRGDVRLINPDGTFPGPQPRAGADHVRDRLAAEAKRLRRQRKRQARA